LHSLIKEEEKKKAILSDGTNYEGTMKGGIKEGKGILFSKEGKILYDGWWKNDKFDGFGIFKMIFLFIFISYSYSYLYIERMHVNLYFVFFK
jgi:hypothetical protein